MKNQENNHEAKKQALLICLRGEGCPVQRICQSAEGLRRQSGCCLFRAGVVEQSWEEAPPYRRTF